MSRMRRKSRTQLFGRDFFCNGEAWQALQRQLQNLRRMQINLKVFSFWRRKDFLYETHNLYIVGRTNVIRNIEGM